MVSPPHCNQTIWRLAVSITAAHSLQNARLTRMWLRSLNTMDTSLCGAIKKPSCYHTWKTLDNWRNAAVGLTKETQQSGLHVLLRAYVKQSVLQNCKNWTFHLILVMSSHAVSVSMFRLSLILKIIDHIWICKDQEINSFIPWQLCHLHLQILRCIIQQYADDTPFVFNVWHSRLFIPFSIKNEYHDTHLVDHFFVSLIFRQKFKIIPGCSFSSMKLCCSSLL